MAKYPNDADQDLGFLADAEAEGQADWFFELPEGAWKRQEEKNRWLRKRLLEQAGKSSSTPPQRDGSVKRSDDDDIADRVDAAVDSHEEGPEREGLGSALQQPSGAEPEDASAEADEPVEFVIPPHFAGDEDEAAPGEPQNSDDEAFALRTPFDPRRSDSAAAERDDASRHLFVVPPHFESDLDGRDPGAEHESDEPPESATITNIHRVSDEPGVDVDHETESEEPTSRWDEELANAGSSGSIIDGMREWAQKGKAADEQPEPVAFDEAELGAERPPLERSTPQHESSDADEPDDDWVLGLLEADEENPRRAPKRGIFARIFGRDRQDGFDESRSLEQAGAEPEWSLQSDDDGGENDDALPSSGMMDEKDPWAEFLSEADDDAAPADAPPPAPEVRNSGSEEPGAGAAPIQDFEPEQDGALLEETNESADAEPAQRDDAPAEVAYFNEESTLHAEIDGDLGDDWSSSLSIEGNPEPPVAGLEQSLSSVLPEDAGAMHETDEATFSDDEPVAWSPEDEPTEPGQMPGDDTRAAAVGAGWDDVLDVGNSADDESRDEATPAEESTKDPWDVIAALGDELEKNGAESEPGVILGFAGIGSARADTTDLSDSEPLIGATENEPEPEESAEGGEDSGWQLARPAAASGSGEDDILLRAFNEHAAAAEDEEGGSVEDEPAKDEGVRFDKLLGDSEGLVHEPMDASTNDGRPYGLPAWAPQRAVDVVEAEEVSGYSDEPQSRPDSHEQGQSDEGIPPPPWATDGEAKGGSRSGHDRAKTLIRELVETGLLALLVFLAVRASFQNFKVEGESMYPTLENGQYIIVNKLAYSEIDMEKLSDFVPFVSAAEGEEQYVFSGPERGTIIVFHSPSNASEDLIKRIIGLPGETLEIVDGQVYINGFRLDEPYTNGDWSSGRDYPRVLIGPDEFFVMGDNRGNSQDSRNPSVGLVGKDLIIGKAMVSYWPRSQMGLAKNDGASLTDEPVSQNAARAAP